MSKGKRDGRSLVKCAFIDVELRNKHSSRRREGRHRWTDNPRPSSQVLNFSQHDDVNDPLERRPTNQRKVGQSCVCLHLSSVNKGL